MQGDLEPLGNDMTFAIDLHTHTRQGSSCSYMQPEQLVHRARELGLDAVCITEHSASWDDASLRALSPEGQPLILGGMEVATEFGDVLVFSANGFPHPDGGVARIADLREAVLRAGGVMIAAHPFRKLFFPGNEPTLEQALKQRVFGYVDAVEVFNGMGIRREQEFALEALRRIGLPGTGGSDSHAPHTLGRCYTVFQRPVADSGDLVEQLRAGAIQARHALMDLTY